MSRPDPIPVLQFHSPHILSDYREKSLSGGGVRVLGATEAGEHPWQCWISLILTPSLSFFGVQSMGTRFPLATVRAPIHFSVCSSPTKSKSRRNKNNRLKGQRSCLRFIKYKDVHFKKKSYFARLSTQVRFLLALL